MNRATTALRVRLTRATVIAIAAVLLIATAAIATHSYLHRHPHMGSPAGDAGTLYQDDIRSGWSVSKWSNCRYVVYYYLDGTIPSSWVTPISNGVTAWDTSTYCGPDWVRTTNAAQAKLKFTRASSLCGSSGTAWIAFACRTYANTPSDQAWTIGFSTYKTFGVATTGTFDVQSITTNEMGHVMYVDHNPSWSDGTTQGNSCTWGSTSCRVTNDTVSGFVAYTTTCTNCGSRRVRLAGDNDTLRHVYGVPCTSICPTDADSKSSRVSQLPSQAALAAQEHALSPDANPADYDTHPHGETMPESNG